jgi:hypothetical protein
MGIAHDFMTTDFHVEAVDLLSNRIPCQAAAMVSDLLLWRLGCLQHAVTQA